MSDERELLEIDERSEDQGREELEDARLREQEPEADDADFSPSEQDPAMDDLDVDSATQQVHEPDDPDDASPSEHAPEVDELDDASLGEHDLEADELDDASLGEPELEANEPDTPPQQTQHHARHKIGIDANRPIHPRTGRIEPQVADPDIIASTGAGWVRLNFVLKPWSDVDELILHDGRTWAEAYEQIIDGFRDRGLYIYGLIGVEAMPRGPGDRFRQPPPAGGAEDEWLDQYVEQFLSIVERFHEDVDVFESFNEPDDWHGQDRNWVHPGWFAIMLQRLYTAVRSNPYLEHVKLVSGPLQGLDANRNAAADYLRATYRAGKAWFGWGQADAPVPFDGVGYHLYVRTGFSPDWGQQEQAIRRTLRQYLEAMHQVIRQEEGRDRPLCVSEVGWNSRIERQEIRRREEFQADSLRVGLETICEDPLVALGCYFCTQDFGRNGQEMHYGLYRAGDLTAEGRKPAFHAFRALCEATVDEEQQERQGEQADEAGQAPSDVQAPGGEGPGTAFEFAEPTDLRGVAGADIWDDEMDLDPSLALQVEILQALKRNEEMTARALDQLRRRDRASRGTGQILLAVAIIAFAVAFVVALATVLIANLVLP